jgi:hypothetical protein
MLPSHPAPRYSALGGNPAERLGSQLHGLWGGNPVARLGPQLIGSWGGSPVLDPSSPERAGSPLFGAGSLSPALRSYLRGPILPSLVRYLSGSPWRGLEGVLSSANRIFSST